MRTHVIEENQDENVKIRQLETLVNIYRVAFVIKYFSSILQRKTLIFVRLYLANLFLKFRLFHKSAL